MAQIGTFSKQREQNPTDIDFDGLVCKWEDSNRIKVAIMVFCDYYMDEPEYHVFVGKDGSGGGGNDLGFIFGTKSRAYDKAYDIMKRLADEPDKFQEYVV